MGRKETSFKSDFYGNYFITWPDNTSCGGGLWGRAAVWSGLFRIMA